MCWLSKLLSPEVKVPYKPVSSKKVSLSELDMFLKDKFPDVSLFLSDNEYTLCHYDDVAYFLATSQIDKMEFVSEELDCDDFAAALWGEFSIPPWSALAVGLVWTEVHTLNIVVTEDMKVLFLEPQTDEINEQLVSWQGTEPRLIII